MNNIEVVSIRINNIRSVIEVAEKEKQFIVSMDELLNILACLERLFIIEKHLINLVSTAYDEELPEEEVNDV